MQENVSVISKPEKMPGTEEGMTETSDETIRGENHMTGCI